MQQLSGALNELDHAFGSAAYASRRARTPAVPRATVPYDGVEPRAELTAPAPAGARPPYPGKRAPLARAHAPADKKRVERAAPRWIDLDDTSAIPDPALLLAARKKQRAEGLDANTAAAAAAGGAASSADGADARDADAEPVDEFEKLLQQHVESRAGRSRRASAAGSDVEPVPNLTPAGEPVDGATRNVARLVAARLEESMSDARLTIERVLALLGTEKVLELLARAEASDASGGMLTCDGTKRRRTRGGIFFYLVKQITNRKEKAYIWPTSGGGGGGGGGSGGGGGGESQAAGAQGRAGARVDASGRRQHGVGRRTNQELLLGPGILRA